MGGLGLGDAARGQAPAGGLVDGALAAAHHVAVDDVVVDQQAGVQQLEGRAEPVHGGALGGRDGAVRGGAPAQLHEAGADELAGAGVRPQAGEQLGERGRLRREPGGAGQGGLQLGDDALTPGAHRPASASAAATSSRAATRAATSSRHCSRASRVPAR